MILAGSLTEKNLMASFIGESIAASKYTYYSKVAKKEGYEQIAAIFFETAEQEKSHAKNFYKFLEGRSLEINMQYPANKIASTIDNLRSAISDENEEWFILYPNFEKIARKEGFNAIATKYKLISKIEKFHKERFSKLLENIETGQIFKREKKVKWICRKCGFTHESESALIGCPACDHPQAYFEILAENY